MQYSKKVAFYTLGCKLNFSETSTISRDFEEAGYAKVDFFDTPDIFVINTCSVTDNADKKCRQLVKKARGINRDSFICIIGCYAQLKPTEIGNIDGVDMVLGANEKFNIIHHIEKFYEKESEEVVIFNEHIKEAKTFVPAYSFGDRTRSFLKVQDGCDYFCAFCTIPLARGTSRSANISATVKKAKEISQTGVKEVVLTGVNIGDFGANTDENFYQLVQELDKVEGIERYRISSIEPNLLSDEIIEFVSTSKKFLPHFHIPLQSGSDFILERMRRRYKSDLYVNRVKKIKELMPNACIGVDVIVGFPSETEEEFIKTYEFLRDLDISYLHVFTYSERANTTAIRFEDTVPMNIRSERSKMLRILSSKKKRKFYESQLGKVYTVLMEEEKHEEMMYGFTENYVKVKLPYYPSLANQLVKVSLDRVNAEGYMDVIKLEKEPIIL